jgi:hypothetical protein
LLIFTQPREVEPRFARDGDQLAIYATHYAETQEIVPVRTVDIARMGVPIVAWVPLMAPPALKHGRAGQHVLTLSHGDSVVEVICKEREQVVIREAVVIEPWESDRECNHETETGTCYLPRNHKGGHDADPADDGAVPERIDPPPATDDMTALMDSLGQAA